MRTNSLNPICPSRDVQPASRALARTEGAAPKAFAQTLATVSRDVASSRSGASTPNSAARAVSRSTQSASLSVVSSKSSVGERAQAGTTTKVVTPFGTYEIPSKPGPPVERAIPLDSPRQYFYTHQPGEWWNDPGLRALFAETYGDKALVTLDYTGTVPENQDPEWVTHVPLDASGRPFPKVWTLPLIPAKSSAPTSVTEAPVNCPKEFVPKLSIPKENQA